MYPVHGLMLNLSMQPTQELNSNGLTLVGFLLVEYEEGGTGLENFEEVDSGETRSFGFEIPRAGCVKN